MWASLPQLVRQPLVPSRKTAYGDKAKSLALRPAQRLCYFGAAFAVRLDDIRLRYSPRPFAPIARQHTLVETAAIARV